MSNRSFLICHHRRAAGPAARYLLYHKATAFVKRKMRKKLHKFFILKLCNFFIKKLLTFLWFVVYYNQEEEIRVNR